MGNFINNLEESYSFIEFEHLTDFYVMQAIERTKDGFDKTKVVDEFYVTSINQLENMLSKWIDRYAGSNTRIYINPNRRRMDKMGFRCMQTLSTYMLEGNYKSIPNLFFNTVGKFSDEPHKKWVVDIDIDVPAVFDNVYNWIDQNHKFINGKSKSTSPNKIYATLKTLNGYHIVCNSFDRMKFQTEFLNEFLTKQIGIHKNSPTLLWCPIPLPIKHSSSDWYGKLYKEGSFKIVDPDGWDRNNFQYSFFEELLTKEEFLKRCFASTCLGNPKEITRKS